MNDKLQQKSRTLMMCVAGGLALMVGLLVYALVLRPYINTRRFIERRLNQGRPIVQAVYNFQRSNGRWPDAMQELVPDVLPEAPPAEGTWTYATSAHEPPVLSGDGGPGRRLMYGFPPRTPALLPRGTDHGWIIDGRDGESFVATD
jgi:hypothetical protein